VLIPFPTCNTSSNFLSDFDFSFSVVDNFKILDLLPNNHNVVGKIHVTRADESQHSDINIRVRVGSESAKEFRQIQVIPSDDGLLIQSPITTATDVSDENPCSFIYVIVYVKPKLMVWGTFDVNSTILSVELDKTATFEGYHFSFSSIYGSIASSNVVNYTILQYVTAHEMRLTTTTGTIFGNWSFGSTMTIEGGEGPIDMHIVPYRWSSGPWTLGILSASTSSGNISIKTPFDKDKLSMRNYTTHISSKSGSIIGALIHGSSTSLHTISGSIDVDILPYNVYRQFGSDIATSSQQGSTDIRILSPIKDSYYNENPLNWTTSSHLQLEGSLKLQYPREWWGRLYGLANRSNLTLQGPELKDIHHQDNRSVSARKGDGGSELLFAVHHGVVELTFPYPYR
jgi:hypothetical protein